MHLSYNAALSSEQRQPPYLNHCTVNTIPNDGMKNAKRWESALNALLGLTFTIYLPCKICVKAD